MLSCHKRALYADYRTNARDLGHGTAALSYRLKPLRKEVERYISLRFGECVGSYPSFMDLFQGIRARDGGAKSNISGFLLSNVELDPLPQASFTLIVFKMFYYMTSN